MVAHHSRRAEDVQLRVADAITRFAGSMTFVMIGQNRQAAFQQIKADHDFVEQELELKTNTELTRAIHMMTMELHRRLIDDGVEP
ncbi:hypothetical protein [Streptomyces sp. NEAU-174]|uniref:hypothetical protein n=1 Tax=Streptomyces sp. NEAU-174 TaxID=3458254 RepID=UPI004043F781